MFFTEFLSAEEFLNLEGLWALQGRLWWCEGVAGRAKIVKALLEKLRNGMTCLPQHPNFGWRSQGRRGLSCVRKAGVWNPLNKQNNP